MRKLRPELCGGGGGRRYPCRALRRDTRRGNHSFLWRHCHSKRSFAKHQAARHYPSYGEIKTAKALTSKIDINVIIRPRGGDFLYTEAEVQSMLLDIELCKELKVHGVVFGCLTKDGDIDVPLMRRLIEAAKPLSVTCHRAFDVCRDPFTALEQLIELGCDRILTSGQQSDAVKGIPLIAELVKRADGRIIIMPGCGVRENNIGKIEAETGAKEFHTSARSIVYSKMEYRNENVPMGSSIVSSEFETVQTDREKVKAYI